jgi:signal transduction histidine kinase
VGASFEALDLPSEVRQEAQRLTAAVRPGLLGRECLTAPDGVAYELLAAPGLSLQAVATDVRELLVSALEPLRAQARPLDVSLRIELAPDLPSEILLDAEKIAWAVTTLVGTALRYTRPGSRLRPGGSIHVAARRIEGEQPAVAISVEDDGPGIPEDRVPWLFTRAPGTPRSAGLSLALINDVVRAHGGTVDVRSSTGALDHGTTVTLVLPAGE